MVHVDLAGCGLIPPSFADTIDTGPLPLALSGVRNAKIQVSHMSGRPWMPLYVADYRVDTAHLSTLEHGAYLLLIMHYWSSGKLPSNDVQLARICGLSDSEWAEIRPVLRAFFGAKWRHRRIDFELSRTSDISNKRRAIALQLHSKRRALAGASVVQLDTHSQSQRKEGSKRTPEIEKEEVREKDKAIAKIEHKPERQPMGANGKRVCG